MTSVLTDRYVATTVRRVPRKHRSEVDRKLRAAIAQAIDAQVELGQTPSDAEYAALTELGDPDQLATRYATGSKTLISPAAYPSYVLTLNVGCAVILPIVYLLNDLGYWPAGTASPPRSSGRSGSRSPQRCTCS